MANDLKFTYVQAKDVKEGSVVLVARKTWWTIHKVLPTGNKTDPRPKVLLFNDKGEKTRFSARAIVTVKGES
jgi:hypothetical protein